MPTHDLPRARISADGEYWNISPTGELSEPSTTPITDLIVDLHTALHLPEDIGMMAVSVLGAILSALIISGIVAHRRIFKDAFRLRTGNNEQLTQGDLHNRMSVWGRFHLMIALTGVYFGLASFLTSIYADTLYEGNKLDLFADIYGSSIQLEHQPAIANIEKALTDIMKMEPNTQPIFVTENATKDNQYILLGSQHLDKLIYSEQYRFDASGQYIDKSVIQMVMLANKRYFLYIAYTSATLSRSNEDILRINGVRVNHYLCYRHKFVAGKTR